MGQIVSAPSCMLDKITIIVLLIGVLLSLTLQTPLKSQPEEFQDEKIKETVVITGNSLRAIAPTYYYRPIVYGTLISCLEFNESSRNPSAVGKTGEIGCLQFLPSTWEQYCEGDIWDCEAQKRCCDKMIRERWNNIYHWTTAKHCIQ